MAARILRKSKPQQRRSLKTSLELFDAAYRKERGVELLIGVDEVGRGPLAGPVVAAAVLLPASPLPELAGVRDSKKLTPQKREALYSVIRRSALAVGVGWVSAEEIDRVNILQATFSAMRAALAKIGDGTALIDGNQLIPGLSRRQDVLVSGDTLSLCIASASIVAKVVRDRWVCVLDKRFPGYGLASHKGYGTAAHYAALERLGPATGLHRRSFLKGLYSPV